MDYGYFSLSAQHDEALNLKSFSSSSTGTKTTIRIVIETDDLRAAGYALQSLASVQKAQSARRSAKSKRAKVLALPAPE